MTTPEPEGGRNRHSGVITSRWEIGEERFDLTVPGRGPGVRYVEYFRHYGRRYEDMTVAVQPDDLTVVTVHPDGDSLRNLRVMYGQSGDWENFSVFRYGHYDFFRSPLFCGYVVGKGGVVTPFISVPETGEIIEPQTAEFLQFHRYWDENSWEIQNLINQREVWLRKAGVSWHFSFDTLKLPVSLNLRSTRESLIDVKMQLQSFGKDTSPQETMGTFAKSVSLLYHDLVGFPAEAVE